MNDETMNGFIAYTLTFWDGHKQLLNSNYLGVNKKPIKQLQNQ